MQARTRADQSFETHHGGNRQIAAGCCKFQLDLPLAFSLAFLELRDLHGGFAMRKTSFRYFANLREVAKRIEQIQQSCIGGAKLTDQRIGLGP